jgi:hypothetical protein
MPDLRSPVCITGNIFTFGKVRIADAATDKIEKKNASETFESLLVGVSTADTSVIANQVFVTNLPRTGNLKFEKNYPWGVF